jgi:hypothetical protein
MLALLLLLASPMNEPAPAANILLDGPDATWQLLLHSPAGDRTRAASYTSSDPKIVRVDARGMLFALANGSAVIKARDGARTFDFPVTVRNADRPRSIHFANDILPLLTRYSCNTSGCHGKAEGQNGFKLSVFGFDPPGDYAALVSEGRGRRLLPAAPSASLFVQKMSGAMAHGGGARLRPGMPGYETIIDWIAAGMPKGEGDAPSVVSLRVEPAEVVLGPKSMQQLRVLARTSDHREFDVTTHARFVSNNEALISVDADGLIRAAEMPGSAAVMANFMNVPATVRVLLPRKEKIAEYPKLPANNAIDHHVHERLRKLQIVPSGVCDDATFLRRVTLDLIGDLPTVDETKTFLADKRPDRRERLVETLLARPEFVDYQAMKWADLLRVDRAALGPKTARRYHAWIRKQVADNVPLDRMARAVITAEGPVDDVPATAFYKATKKPGEMASSLSQVFLGVRIACAECHHHPFDRWGQDDYHAMTAYFQGVSLNKRGVGEVLEVTGTASRRHPRTGELILARPLGEKTPEKIEPGDLREQLAERMTSRENAYFARNLANRIWAQLMGRGLIEPVDDIRDTNPPSNPELLETLAKHLIESKFDGRKLIRFIVASRAYQRDTKPNATNADDTQNFSRGLLRRVPAEVLCDMISRATAVPERFEDFAAGTKAVQLWDSKVPHYFLKSFGRPERSGACECDRITEPSVAQVLHLLNAPEIEAKLTHAAGLVGRLAKAEKEDRAKIETLYLAFFSRYPSEKDCAQALAHLRAATEKRKALEDLAWSLLNTLEFAFNH